MQSILRPYLYREKVAGDYLLPMSAEELLPGRLPAPFWGWFDAMLFQNIGKCYVPAGVRGWQVRPESGDNPSFDFPRPCESPAQQFQPRFVVVREYDGRFHRISWRSAFGARPTESPESR